MWLLKFHVSVCILCWIATVSMRNLFKDRYKRYRRGSKRAKFRERLLAYACPIVNVVFVVTLLWMARAPDSFVDEFNKRQGDLEKGE